MELRKDYILDEWVIISQSRGNRPHQFAQAAPEKVDVCYFCPGHEDMVPPEKYRKLGKDGAWQIRVFENKFPAVSLSCEGRLCDPRIKTADTYFTYADAIGVHEVIVETNQHDKQLWDLAEPEVTDILKTYAMRIELLHQMPGVQYVSVFKNSGKEAGTSIQHSHSQIIATSFLPKLIREKLFAVKERNFCPYCDILRVERQSYRRCFENERFVAFAPYASRFHYEIWVMPKEHLHAMDKFTEAHFTDLAQIMVRIFAKLKVLGAPYNFFLHYHPDKEFHFMIEVTPRLATWAGFEESSSIIINSVSPESAAEFYRS